MYRCSIEPLEGRCLLATNGLSATYFNNTNFTGSTYSRTDSQVLFEWPNHARPAPPIKGTTFAVRWSGLVQPQHSQTYTFFVRSNDGVRLWVNGKKIIDGWFQTPRITRSGSIALTANQFYDIRLEYFDQKRTAGIRLDWSSVSTPHQAIPPSRLLAYDIRSGAFGDYGRNNDAERKMATLVQALLPQFLITLGDNNYPDGAASTIDANVGQYFHNYIYPYNGAYGGSAKSNAFFPTLGNHDWTPDDVATPYLNYFRLPGNERYYDFVRGPVHFFALDSDPREPDGISSESTQGEWLEAKLAESTSPFNIVYFHHAPFASGDEGSSAWMQWPFESWGADLVLSGHNHIYERISRSGFPYIVSGTGSGGGDIDRPVSGSVIRNNTTSGALLVMANDRFLTAQYQLSNGDIVDTITITP